MIETLLGSRDKEHVLQYILAKSDGYAFEIANFYGTKPSQINKQLEALESGGVLVSHLSGRTRIFKFNPEYPFLKELKALLVKVRGAYADDLQKKLLTPTADEGEKLLHFRQVINRNIHKKFDLSQIASSLKGKDFLSKTDDEKFIIGRFFLEATESDLQEVLNIRGLTKTSLKSLYLTSPYSKNPADTEWHKRFGIPVNKTYHSINPSGNRALLGLLNKKGLNHAV